jgi:hypothetical protein
MPIDDKLADWENYAQRNPVEPPQPPDVYPLGLGKGLMTDILNFGLNNLYQYGQSFGQTNQRIGQVMTDIAAGKENQDLGPLTKELLAMSPGPIAGTWGPIRTPLQKQAVRAAWRHDPERVAAVAADPQMLNVTVPKPNVETARVMQDVGWMPEGATAAFEPTRSELRVAPATMVGGHYQKPMSDDIFEKILGSLSPSPELQALRKRLTTPRIETRPGGTTDLPEAMGHELTHFLNRDRVYSRKHWEQAPEIVDALSPYLNEHSINAAIEAGLEHKNPNVAIDEMLAYLSGKSTRNPENEAVGKLLDQFLKVRTDPRGNVGAAITPNAIKSAIRMATEATDPIYGTSAKMQWDKLSKEGLLPMREGYYKPPTAYKDNPKFSMRERTEPAPMYDRLARASRTFTSPTDIIRGQAGENLPPLGSAMPDIPRPVSSPGGLDFFENLRAKLGLPPADLGGMAPEFYGKKTPLLESKRGADALDEIFQNWLGEHNKIVDPNYLTHPESPKDAFMSEVLGALGKAASHPLPGPTIGSGVSGFRRHITPLAEEGFSQSLPAMGKPLDAQKSLDILDHLRQYGFMEPENLDRAIQVGGQIPYIDPQRLDRIKALLDRVGYDPATGATKGNPERLLKSKRGGQALDDIYRSWTEQRPGQNPPMANIKEMYPKDAFMQNIFQDLAEATEALPAAGQSVNRGYAGLPHGVKRFRWAAREASAPDPFHRLAPAMGTHPQLGAEKTLDILDHLRSAGMFDPDRLAKTLVGRGRHDIRVDPEGLKRIEQLLERLQYEPTTGAWKGNPGRKLP